MKTEQAPHEKLTEDEIENLINDLYKNIDSCISCFMQQASSFLEAIPKEGALDENLKGCSLNLANIVFSIKYDVLNKLNILEELIVKLKKHTCPEKFSIMKASIAEISDAMKATSHLSDNPETKKIG
jgi:hypothetical protein